MWCTGFSLVAEYGLSCLVAHGILLSQPGIKSFMSPELDGGFLTTGPPGKSQVLFFLSHQICVTLLWQFWETSRLTHRGPLHLPSPLPRMPFLQILTLFAPSHHSWLSSWSRPSHPSTTPFLAFHPAFLASWSSQSSQASFPFICSPLVWPPPQCKCKF